MIVESSDKWPTAQQSGRLVEVEIKPGVCIKMYEREARAKGLWPPVEMRASKPVGNKRRRTSRNKATSQED